jgi:hypothetical protein
VSDLDIFLAILLAPPSGVATHWELTRETLSYWLNFDQVAATLSKGWDVLSIS